MNPTPSHNHWHRVITNIGWLGANRLLQLATGFFVGAWVARYLGPKEYGTLSFALAWVALFSPLMQVSGGMVLVRNFVREPGQAGTAFATATVLRLAGAVVMVGAALLAARLYSSEKTPFVLFVGILAIAQCTKTTAVVELWFESQVKSKFSALASSAAIISSAALRISLILFEANLEAFIWAVAAEWVIQSIALIIMFRRFGSLPVNKLRPSMRYARSLLADAWPMIFSGLASTIYMRIDQVMLALMAGDAAVGTYSAATRITEAAFIIPNIVCISLFPALVKASQADKAVYLQRLSQLFALLQLTALVLVLLLSVGANPITTLLYGHQYQDSAAVLRIHSIALLFVFFAVPSGRHLVAKNHVMIAMTRPIFGAIVNIILNLQLIPRYGANGAAIATVISYFGSSLIAILPFTASRPLARMFFHSMNPLAGWAVLRSLFS